MRYVLITCVCGAVYMCELRLAAQTANAPGSAHEWRGRWRSIFIDGKDKKKTVRHVLWIYIDYTVLCRSSGWLLRNSAMKKKKGNIWVKIFSFEKNKIGISLINLYETPWVCVEWNTMWLIVVIYVQPGTSTVSPSGHKETTKFVYPFPGPPPFAVDVTDALSKYLMAINICALYSKLLKRRTRNLLLWSRINYAHWRGRGRNGIIVNHIWKFTCVGQPHVYTIPPHPRICVYIVIYYMSTYIYIYIYMICTNAYNIHNEPLFSICWFYSAHYRQHREFILCICSCVYKWIWSEGVGYADRGSREDVWRSVLICTMPDSRPDHQTFMCLFALCVHACCMCLCESWVCCTVQVCVVCLYGFEYFTKFANN